MATEVLQPQDCLIQRISVSPAVHNRRRTCHDNGNARFRKPVSKPEKKRFNCQLEPSVLKSQSGNSHRLATGQVTLLRRDESSGLGSRLRSDKPLERSCDGFAMAPKRIQIGDLKSALSAVTAGDRSDLYAGSAFSMSPSPSALPLPSFFSKKQSPTVVDDSASRDLRRLLGLD